MTLVTPTTVKENALSDLVAVPWSLQKELGWLTSTTEARLTEALLRKVGLTTLDPEDPHIQWLFTYLMDDILVLVKKRPQAPDKNEIRDIAREASDDLDVETMIGLANSLGLGKSTVSGFIETIEMAMQGILIEEISRILTRAATPPPPRSNQQRRRRPAA